MPRSKESVIEFLRRWLQTYAASNVSPRTADGYRSKIDTYIRPAFGNIELQQLQATTIQSLYTKMLKRNLSPQTVLHAHRVLRQALGQAVKWGDLNRNPTDRVATPRPLRRQVDMWAEKDFAKFLQIIPGHRFADFYLILLYTGLRRSEAAGLSWRNVFLPETDNSSGSLRVVHTLQRIRGQGLVVGQPKTAKSRRNVELSSSTAKLLHGIRGQQRLDQTNAGDGWHNDRELVFTKQCGCPINPDDATKEFTNLVRESGLPKITLHGLRHGHATLLLIEGVHPKVVSERLGHESIQITLDLYSHVIPGIQASAAALLDSKLEDLAKVKTNI